MKQLIGYLFLLVTIVSCKNSVEKSESITDFKANLERDSEKRTYQEIKTFDAQLVTLYQEAEQNPELTLTKADSLFSANVKSNRSIKNHINDRIRYFKAEIFYKLGNYKKSLGFLEQDSYQHCETALALAANYTKLNEHNKAKSFIDSIGCYIYDYALGNYYESIGDRKKALNVYYKIQKNKEIKHYAYYPLAVDRIKELEKSSPKLLQEMYYPTGDPSFEICYSDSENRSKIFDMVMSMPECKNYGVHIYQSPQTNDKDYYWIKVSNADHNYNGENYDAVYDFFIYPKNFDIRYYDLKSGKLFSLEEWRRIITTK